MSLNIVLLLLSITSLKIRQKCDAKQSPSMQLWRESLHRQHHHEFRKKLRRSSHISYYSNTSATHRILLGGENEMINKQNSKKATTKHKTPICLVCEKTVRINSKRLICTYCKLLAHLHCTNIKLLTISNTKNANEWICFSCPSIELPFHEVKDESNTNGESDGNYINEHRCHLFSTYTKFSEKLKFLNVSFSENFAYVLNGWSHLEKLDELQKHISICHLNTQSMSSTFAEFQFMINQTKL